MNNKNKMACASYAMPNVKVVNLITSRTIMYLSTHPSGFDMIEDGEQTWEEDE